MHSFVIACALAWLLAYPAASEEAHAVQVAQAVEEETTADRRARTTPPADESSETQQAGGDVEVMFVKGRTAAAIETDVPSSITQFDASTIQALGAQDVSDLARVTPNVNIVQPGATQATFYVRGIGLQSFDANATGAVTIFQDAVALDLPAIQTGQLFDIQDVQILRGPQGTGPYRNASAGAIRVQSNLPTGNYGGQLRSSIGRYAADGGKGAHHGLIQDYEGYVESPIVPEMLSTRLAFRLRNSEPYQTNGCGNAPPIAARVDPTPGNRTDPTAPGGPRPLDREELLAASDICGERGDTIWPNPNAFLGESGISRIPVGLDDEVDFEDTWAARGFLRFQPPDTEYDFVLNGHGSKLDEDQTYGQAIGTSNVRTGSLNRGRFFGGSAGNSGTPDYWEPDQKEEFLAICRTAPCNGLAGEPTVAAFERSLAQGRPLDRRPYRGDYNREGKTTRDTWGGYASGKAQITDDLEIFALGSYRRLRSLPRYRHRLHARHHVRNHGGGRGLAELRRAARRRRARGDAARMAAGWLLPPRGARQRFGDVPRRQFADRARILAGHRQLRSLGELLLGLPRRRDARWRCALELGAQEVQAPPPALLVRWHDSVAGRHDGRRRNLADTDRQPDPDLSLEAGSIGVREVQPRLQVRPLQRARVRGDRAAARRPRVQRRLGGRARRGLVRPARIGYVNYFYYRYEDYQIFLFRDVANEPPVLEIVNAAQAENYGIEVEGRLLPLRGWVPQVVEGLQLSANASWLHGEFLDFQIRNKQVSGPETVPITIDFSGDQLLNSPEFKASGAVTWDLNFGRFGYVIPRYDFSWTDDVFFGLNDGRGTSTADLQGTARLPELAVGQEAYWIHNVRLAYRTPTGNVEVAVFCRNLEDTVYKNYAFDATNFSQVVLNFVGTPRTIGVDMIVTF